MMVSKYWRKVGFCYGLLTISRPCAGPGNTNRALATRAWRRALFIQSVIASSPNQ